METEGDFQKKAPKFDPDLSPSAEVNTRAAKARGWRWDPGKQCYRDSDGYLIADRYGQPLG